MPSPSQKRKVDTIVSECHAVRLRALNRSVTSIYDDALRPHGVRVSQFNILVAAAKMGVARPAEVCRVLDLDASTLSRNVERMRSHGWLEAIADEADARAQPFQVTAAGWNLIDQAFPAWEQAQQQAAELLGEQRIDALHRDQEA